MLAVKKEVLSFAPTWKDLEGIMLSEISYRKTNTASFHVYVEPKNSEPGTHSDIENKRGFQRERVRAEWRRCEGCRGQTSTR